MTRDDLAAALTEHAGLIAGEVLAVEFGPVEAMRLMRCDGADGD